MGAITEYWHRMQANLADEILAGIIPKKAMIDTSSMLKKFCATPYFEDVF